MRWPFQSDSRLQWIDGFKLSNLFNNQIRFEFFNLAPDFFTAAELEDEKLSTTLKQWFKAAQPTTPADLERWGGDESRDRLSPMVLICASGKTSKSVATQLMDHQFVNVYIVAGGWKSLLAEG